jgi:hypothetical protein
MVCNSDTYVLQTCRLSLAGCECSVLQSVPNLYKHLCMLTLANATALQNVLNNLAIWSIDNCKWKWFAIVIRVPYHPARCYDGEVSWFWPEMPGERISVDPCQSHCSSECLKWYCNLQHKLWYVRALDNINMSALLSLASCDGEMLWFWLETPGEWIPDKPCQSCCPSESLKWYCNLEHKLWCVGALDNINMSALLSLASCDGEMLWFWLETPGEWIPDDPCQSYCPSESLKWYCNLEHKLWCVGALDNINTSALLSLTSCDGGISYFCQKLLLLVYISNCLWLCTSESNFP